MEPVNAIKLGGTSVSMPRAFSITGSPISDDIRSIIVKSFEINSEEDVEAIHQFLLSRSPSSDIDDIKLTLNKILSGDNLPNKTELVNHIKQQLTEDIKGKSLDEIVNHHKTILDREMSEIQDRAIETGDWKFFLRGAQKRKALDEIGDFER